MNLTSGPTARHSSRLSASLKGRRRPRLCTGRSTVGSFFRTVSGADDRGSDPERRRRAHVPIEIQKQSKIKSALDLIDRATLWDVPFGLVTSDTAYGHFRDFLRGLEARKLLYACGAKCNFGVRRPEEVRTTRETPLPPRKGTFGRKPKRRPAPLYRVDEVIAELSEAELSEKVWKTVTWREGYLARRQ